METYIAKAKRDLAEMRMSWNRCPCMTELEAGTLARAQPAAGRAGRRAGARLTQPGRPLVSADVLQSWPETAEADICNNDKMETRLCGWTWPIV